MEGRGGVLALGSLRGQSPDQHTQGCYLEATPLPAWQWLPSQRRRAACSGGCGGACSEGCGGGSARSSVTCRSTSSSTSANCPQSRTLPPVVQNGYYRAFPSIDTLTFTMKGTMNMTIAIFSRSLCQGRITFSTCNSSKSSYSATSGGRELR